MQTEQLLCWSGMTDTEHSTTSSSNKEEEQDPQKNNCTDWIFQYTDQTKCKKASSARASRFGIRFQPISNYCLPTLL